MNTLKATSIIKAAAAGPVNVQTYMPQGARRELTEAEESEIRRRKRKLLPKLFRSYSDSPSTQISSPLLGAALLGTMGAGAGGLLGSRFGGTGAAVGAGVGGTLGGILGYHAKRVGNDNVVENMRRLPEGATLRDYYADTLYQLERNRAAYGAGSNVRAGALGAILASSLNS